MLFETVQSLEDKLNESEDLLNKLYSDNLKSMLYVQKDVSNKPSMIIDDLGTST
jgi:phosphoribosylpyrophosphate synthetase